MRIPGQVSVAWSPEGVSGSGSDSGSASGGGGGASEGRAGAVGTSGSDAGSGAGATPSGTPSTATPSTTPASVPAGGDSGDEGVATDIFDFSGLLGGDFGDGDVTVPPVEAAVIAPIAAATPPVPATPVVTPPAPAAPVAPAAVEAGAVAPTGQQRPLSAAEPERLMQAMVEHEPAIIAEAARSVFALSQQEIQELEENAVGAIPKLLARAYIKSQQNMLSFISKAVPAMLGQQLGMRTRNEANANKFFDRWKDAGVTKEHAPTVQRLAVMYRQMHPSATLDQMVEDLGPMVIMAARIAPPTTQPATATATAARAAVGGANGAGRQTSPFVPAGGGVAAGATAVEGSPWDILDPNHAG